MSAGDELSADELAAVAAALRILRAETETRAPGQSAWKRSDREPDLTVEDLRAGIRW